MSCLLQDKRSFIDYKHVFSVPSTLAAPLRKLGSCSQDRVHAVAANTK